MKRRPKENSSRRDFLKRMVLGGIGAAFSSLLDRPSVYGDQPGGAPAAQPPSPRERIRFQNEWKFQKESPSESSDLPQIAPDFDDQAWEAVGVPHCYNDLDTYENAGLSRTFQGNAWYRTRFTLPAAVKGRKIFLEFQGVTNGAAVYVNGKFKREIQRSRNRET